MNRNYEGVEVVSVGRMSVCVGGVMMNGVQECE